MAQGLFEGHLYIKRDVPAGLVRLANPYDPTADAAYTEDVLDLSYYKGRLYLYFGIAPALVLFCPYHALTGGYLSERTAIAILFSLGFAAGLGLGRAICRRYFPEIKPWTFTAYVLALGLAIGLGFSSAVYEHMDWRVSGNVYEVAVVSGFAFAMLALAAIWRAIHSKPKWQAVWLSLASLAYGLAVASRPSLLFGGIVLLIPVVQIWCESAGRSRHLTTFISLAAASVPITMIGVGLMLYNDLRFGNPLEFGWRYTVSGVYDATTARTFSAHYLCFNMWTYFLQPLHLKGDFPFVYLVPLNPPVGYDAESLVTDGGILWHYPFVLLAMAAPLAWKGRPLATALSRFATACLFLFLAIGVTVCLYLTAAVRYKLDFLPELMLLSLIGFLGLKRAVLPFFPGAVFVRWGWRLILSYSVIFSLILSVISSVKSHAKVDSLAGNSYFHHDDFEDALVQFRNAERLWPDYPDAHYGLANTLMREGDLDNAISEYQKALKFEPDSPEANNNLAFTLLRAGRVDDAIKYFQKASELQKNYETFYNLGYAYRVKKMAVEAETNWQKAIELEPEFIPAQIDLSWMLATWPDAAARNGAKALGLMENLDRQVPNNPKILRTLAAAYAETGHFSEAVTTAKQALTLAQAQSQSALAKELRAEITLYQSNTPCSTLNN